MGCVRVWVVRNEVRDGVYVAVMVDGKAVIC